jgi:excinuclease ABC subunit A
MLPICLRGARTHNLKDVDLDLRPGQLVALTGRSGAGKSSLAMDTLYAEGQRRFVESFSPYARQFLERLLRPPVERLDPIAATVAVDRRAPVKSSRSTLATLADLEPYLSALFAAEALPFCLVCQRLAHKTSPAEAAAALCAEHPGARAVIAFPPRADQSFAALREDLLKQGFRRLLVGDETVDLESLDPAAPPAAPPAADSPARPFLIVADRLSLRAEDRGRLQDAIEACWVRGGRAEVFLPDSPRKDRVIVAPGLRCAGCQRTFEPPHTRLFSYNSPLGACPTCKGFGRVIDLDWDKVVPDERLSIAQGAVRPFTGKSTAWERRALARFAEKRGIPMDVPYADLTPAQKQMVLEGEGTWTGGKYPGVRAWFQWLETRTYKMHVRVLLSRYREYALCGACQGARLSIAALGYQVDGLHLGQWHALTVAEALRRIDALSPTSPQGRLAHAALRARLRYLDRVGLSYLTLDRQGRTLSGGEAQRAGLTTALGAGLCGTLFVLDEPSVGLHPADVPRLGEAMAELAQAGNTVLLIEHDEALVRACERVIELGPGAGPDGGQVLFDGPPAALLRREDLPTAQAWCRRMRPDPDGGRAPRERSGVLSLRKARENNLQDVDVDVPLGLLCAVTGPSGSGKSTLAVEVLYRAVARRLGDVEAGRPGACASISGHEGLRRAVLVDQSPLGRTARGNAATYTKAWDRLRARFAAEPEAQVRGLTPGHFSFNVAGGRCESCAGEGHETVEMQFLADVSYPCPVCQGQRFRPEVLAVRHQDLSVADVLRLTVDEVLARLDAKDAPDRALRRALEPVVRVGLGYLPLGQPLSTLSGGEAQRLKLARALSEQAAGALFVVDEPSAGLHARDVEAVIDALHLLVEQGASVLVVEHDLDLIERADWVIDLGPGAGPDGGRIVDQGTPAQLAGRAARTGSRTGAALQALRRRREESEAAPTGEVAPPAGTGADLPRAIVVEHAREHNLREVSCQIPHGALTVLTGPSGSGKSSLAFDVVFAEGQRRFMETLTPYARQFLPALPRPDVDGVSGVPPAIALPQRTTRSGANSTVATVTEVAHYLRLLFAKVGQPHCPRCEREVRASSPDAIYEHIRALAAPAITVSAPVVRARKGTHLQVFELAAREGIKAAIVDGKRVTFGKDAPPKLAKTREHTIDLIVYEGRPAGLSRQALDRALSMAAGDVRVAAQSGAEELLSTARACVACGTGVPELDPRWFSFNTKQGQCERCEGSGLEPGDDEEDAERLQEPCSACAGARLGPVPRRVRLCGLTYAEFTRLSVGAALRLCQGPAWRFSGTQALIAKAPSAELVRRLAFIAEVGLSYLGLDRPADTLSGGEMQRLRLSAQLGSGLTGALYVLDEPTIGLHPRDTALLLRNLRALTDTGSTVLLVEHDEETIRAADHLIDLGPGGGRLGGRIIAAGPAAQVLADPASPTAQALRHADSLGTSARPPATAHIALLGATAHNLQGADLTVPVGRFCVVAGVSGSGKSTLVRQVFYPALRKALGLTGPAPLGHGRLEGAEQVSRALAVDQSPIGRTPRSVPATFLGIWDDIRRLYAGLAEAKLRGFGAARFSFNTASGGRCPACEGQGMIVSEMSFLPDVVTTCEACGGARFEPGTLEVRYRGLHIGEVLRLSAEEAAELFSAHRRIARPLRTLCDLGLSYLQLGQGSNTLSGGEAQRLKLAAELTATTAHKPTVYVLDEPTTGLHLSDVRRLIDVLQRLVDRGDTLVVIEHHLDVIRAADWVIELGPEAGEDGGRVVFRGPPAALAQAGTNTGKALARALSAEAEGHRAQGKTQTDPGARAA